MRRISAATLAASLVLVAAAGPALASSAPHAPRVGKAAADQRGTSDRLVAATSGTRATPGRTTPSVAKATAGTGTPLPMSGFGDIVADEAHGRVYVSGGDGQSGLTVLDSAGVVERTVPGLPGASDMVLSDDGSVLYVALANGDGIEQIDTSTLGTSSPTMTKFSTGATTCPTSVAVSAGLVWFGYGCTSSQQIGTLDPATSTVNLAVIPNLFAEVALASSPQAPGVLLVSTLSQSPDFLSRYAVTGGATPAATQTASIQVGGNFGDMAITPDGSDVIVADGAVYHHQVYSTADLSADGTYATDSYPDSVAINADGLVAAGIDGIYSPDIWVYSPGATSPKKKFDFGSGNYLVSGGLAFIGTSIYAVTGDFGAPYTLHVVSTLPSASLAVSTAKKSYGYGGRVRVTVKLKQPGSNQHVAVYGTPYGGQPVLVKKGSFSGGSFSASARVDRRSTFTAVWGGNASYGPTERSTTVTVRAKVVSEMRGYYAAQHAYRLYHLHKNPKQVAVVLPNHAGECLDFRAQKPNSHGRWATFGTTGCIPMSSSSAAAVVLTGTHAVGERVRFRAEWGGDRANLRQHGPWQYARFTR